MNILQKSLKPGFVYLFVNLPYFWKCKIGISRQVDNRRRYVQKTTPGLTLAIWAVYVPFARSLERQIHVFFSPFRSSFREGSGRSEWFFTLPVLPMAWIVINFMFLLYWSPVIGLIWWAWSIL